MRTTERHKTPEVAMPDGSTYQIKSIVSDGTDNTKHEKSMRAIDGYKIVNISLAPATVAGAGNVCGKETPGCSAGCIFTAGMGRYDSTQRARIARTRLFKQDRPTFLRMLRRDLTIFRAAAMFDGVKLACRLNNFSDLAWERIDPELFAEFPDVQFYDYTKHPKRLGTTPKNYHLTLSRSEMNESDCLAAIRRGFNVAIPFHRAIPVEWRGFPVIDGDRHDYRFLDPRGVVVGLVAKGRGRPDQTGFVIR